MEPISFFVVVGFAIVAISIKHIFESCKSNSNDNEDFPINTDENDYENLITRLKEISTNITLLEKIIFK